MSFKIMVLAICTCMGFSNVGSLVSQAVEGHIKTKLVVVSPSLVIDSILRKIDILMYLYNYAYKFREFVDAVGSCMTPLIALRHQDENFWTRQSKNSPSSRNTCLCTLNSLVGLDRNRLNLLEQSAQTLWKPYS